jgi:hypothetical protein
LLLNSTCTATSRRLEEAKEAAAEAEAARAVAEAKTGELERERDAAMGELRCLRAAAAVTVEEVATLGERAAAGEARAAAAEVGRCKLKSIGHQ